MATLKELRERRGALENRFKEIIEKAEAEDRDLTQDEENNLKKIHDDDTALKNRIKRQEELDKLGKELDEPSDRKISGRGSAAGDGFQSDRSDAETEALAIQGWCRQQMGENLTDEQREACSSAGINPLNSKLPISLSQNWSGVRRDWRNGMTTVQPGKGGTLIAPTFVQTLEVAMLHHGGILQVADLMDTETGAEMSFPTMNDTGNEGAMVAELEEADEQDIATGAVKLGAHEGTSKVVVVSQSQMDDSAFNLVGVLGDALGERLGKLLNRKCTTGVNSNEARGVVTRATVGKTTASATAITADECMDLVYSVNQAYRNSPSFAIMAHELVWLALRKLKATDGSYLWQRSLTEGAPDRFIGYPIAENTYMDSALTASKKVMLAGDFSKYKVRRVRGITLRRMQEVYAKQNADGFVAFIRFDGDLIDAGTNPIKLLKMKDS